MLKYTLSKITLKNFKLFGGKPYSINFNNDSLVVFDGPNGYGKTSIFDAIELALTGDIGRLYQVENRQAPKDVVVAYKGSKDVEIRIEFNSKDPVTIIRRLKKQLPSQAGKIKNFSSLWELYYVSKDGKEEQNEEVIHQLLKNNQITRDFKLFHYVQQEETAFFLKSQKEHERARALGELFGDTKGAEKKKDKLEKTISKINSVNRHLLEKKKNYETQYGIIKDQLTIKPSLKYKHFYLFPWLEDKPNSPEWDNKNIENLTLNKRDVILKDLKKVEDLVLHKDIFILENKYKKGAGADDILKIFIRYYTSLDQAESLRTKYNQSRTISSALKYITIDHVDEIEEKCDLLNLFKIVSYEKGDTFLEELKKIIQTRKHNKGNSQLYTELIQYRRKMKKQLEDLEEKKNCPLCGAEYETAKILIKAIETRGDSFKKLLSEDDEAVVALQESFSKKVINPLTDALSSFYESLNAPTEQFLKGIENAVKIKKRLEKLKKWLFDESIQFSDICVEYSPVVLLDPECEKLYQILSQRILEKSPVLSEEYIETNRGNIFESIFAQLFDSKNKYLKETTPIRIQKKIGYINSLYFSSLTKVMENYNLLKKNISELQIKKKSIKKIKDIIQKEIRLYHKSLIADIEIPFYIYSGKILQSHQAGSGNGIFIKDPTGGDELKNIRLVSDWESDHDILNTMSSGQISAIVIAFTLALNKVYAGSLNSILIDDPIQTMDDINMISFIELLRNDFGKHQIILSTHQEDISRYILYKFLKHGHKVRKINLMEQKEYHFNRDSELSM
jgi:exonuclease SbcC